MLRIVSIPCLAAVFLGGSSACRGTADSGPGFFSGPSTSDTIAASIVAVSGDGQSATAGLTLPDPLVVQVQGIGEQPVAGVPVRWTVIQGGGALDSAITRTDDQGHASNSLTLGDSTGPQTVVATLDADTTAQATFTATATDVSGAVDVKVISDAFMPSDVMVLAGGVVTWTWASGSTDHNITWVLGGFEDASDRSSGTHQVTFPTAGTFGYYCSIHGTPTTGMRGTVTVTN
jgi:plastocyanin